MQKKIPFFIFIALLIAGLFFRLWNINFGLPHSFYADEPEIAELAIKYTYELKSIIVGEDFYKLIPISFVYGTFPTYILTAYVMGASKFMNIVNISFDKTTLYVLMRVLMVIVSLLIAVAGSKLYKKLFNDSFGYFLTLGLLALNWKFIVHAHYVNADIILTALLSFSFLLLYSANEKGFDNKNTVFSAILFGAAVGTKFTALISLPLFLFLFLSKKDLVATLGFCATAFLTFMATNPFSILFFQNFSYRIFEMFFKEGGLVFDSVDSNPLKYVKALFIMLGTLTTLIAVLGIFKSKRTTGNKNFHIFLIGNILIYIVFYSLQTRRVDRWLLPILPIVIIYAANGINFIRSKFSPKFSKLFYAVFILFVCSQLSYPILLLTQFRRDTPKSASYKWVRENVPLRPSVLPYILVYTEEGLDPLNKIDQARVYQVNVYESENAQLFYPEDPTQYEYVIVSSRPLSNYKRPEVIKKYPDLIKRWMDFETKINDTNEFRLIKDFTLSKPNLIPLSDISIYQNLKFQNRVLVNVN